MTKQLASDVARCHGFCCQQRERCARYTERENYTLSTPFASHLCDKNAEGLEHFIHSVEESK